MRRVLITRSEPQAFRLAKKLHEAHIDTVLCSVWDITYPAMALSYHDVSEAALWVWTSEHAVHAAADFLSCGSQSLPRFAAVGGATQQALRDGGYDAWCPKPGAWRADAVTDWALGFLKPGDVVDVWGGPLAKGGRWLMACFEAAGVAVRYHAVYQRKPREVNVSVLQRAVAGGISAVLLHSEQGARQWAAWQQAGCSLEQTASWVWVLGGMPEGVATAISSCHNGPVFYASDASDASMLQALAILFPDG